MANFVISTLGETVMITAFVLIMMVVIEYVNIQTRNLWSDRLRQSTFTQIIIAALLGITPGCLGAFTIVSLYTHRIVGLAALVTVMIATSGDEAFVMFALFPGKALILHLSLFVIAVVSGWLVSVFSQDHNYEQHGFTVHKHENCRCLDWSLVLPQLRRISFERALLVLITTLFVIVLLTGMVGPGEWNWKKYTFLAGSLFMLFIFITVPEHFLTEHFYNHILKKHLVRIFLWTWGAFIVLHFVESGLHFTEIIENRQFLILLIAVFIGIIPESGPHLVFVTLFSQNLIPFSILLANSIVQDGHGILPLLAESRRDFLKVKAINLIVGFLIGVVSFFLGY